MSTSDSMVALYRRAGRRSRRMLMDMILRAEGGEELSTTARRIHAELFGITVGMYTNGGFAGWDFFDPPTTIGRFSSIASGVRLVNHNHPLDAKSTSHMFYNPKFGYVQTRDVESRPLTVGNDVWIGANAVVLPEVSTIGDGAVVGAGAVVHRDVPPYAVVLGNPARVVRYRFPESVIADLLAERWWDRDLDELRASDAFRGPLRHPLLAPATAGHEG